jgi:hypothetical protein
MGLIFNAAKFKDAPALKARMEGVRDKWTTQGSIDSGNVVLVNNNFDDAEAGDRILTLDIKVNGVVTQKSFTPGAKVECAAGDITNLVAALNAADWKIGAETVNSVIFSAAALVLTIKTVRRDANQSIEVAVASHNDYNFAGGDGEGAEQSGTTDAAWADTHIQSSGYDGNVWYATWLEPSG